MGISVSVAIIGGTVAASSATAATWCLDPVEKTLRVLDSVEWVVATSYRSTWAEWKKGQANWLALRVCAVEFADCRACINDTRVSDECGALRSPCSIVLHSQFCDVCNSLKQVLERVSFGI